MVAQLKQRRKRTLEVCKIALSQLLKQNKLVATKTPIKQVKILPEQLYKLKPAKYQGSIDAGRRYMRNVVPRAMPQVFINYTSHTNRKDGSFDLTGWFLVKDS